MTRTERLTADQLTDGLQARPGTVRARAGKIPAVRLSPKVLRYVLADVVRARRSNGGPADA